MKLIITLISCSIFIFVDGAQIPKPDNRIVGGQDADISNHGYQVSVQKEGKHHCGGTILNNYWVLTAAHCIYRNADEYTIRVDSNQAEENGVIYDVVEIIKHPGYSILNFDFDATLLRVEEPIRLNGGSVRAVKLIDLNEDVPAGTNVVLTGWGRLTEGGEAHLEQLQMVSVPIIDTKKCKARYDEESKDLITENMICAGVEEGGKDTCQFDSGGPVVNEKKDTIIGIVSFGMGCGLPGVPGVYTRVAAPSIRNFIKEHTGL